MASTMTHITAPGGSEVVCFHGNLLSDDQLRLLREMPGKHIVMAVARRHLGKGSMTMFLSIGVMGSPDLRSGLFTGIR